MYCIYYWIHLNKTISLTTTKNTEYISCFPNSTKYKVRNTFRVGKNPICLSLIRVLAARLFGWIGIRLSWLYSSKTNSVFVYVLAQIHIYVLEHIFGISPFFIAFMYVKLTFILKITFCIIKDLIFI